MSEYNKKLQPWQNGRAHKAHWASAQDFYDYYTLNPSHGALKMAKAFNMVINHTSKMLSKFRSGWNPSTAPAWLAFKEQYLTKQEALNAAPTTATA